MPRVHLETAPRSDGTSYPDEFAEACLPRRRWRLGDAGGLTQFGVNLLRLPDGAWSAQRHWHSAEDEFVHVLEGEVVLVDDHGETILRAGDCAAFPAGDGNGHKLENRSGADALLLEIGSRRPDVDRVTYPDIDMTYTGGEAHYRHRDGTPYPPYARRS